MVGGQVSDFFYYGSKFKKEIEKKMFVLAEGRGWVGGGMKGGGLARVSDFFSQRIHI